MGYIKFFKKILMIIIIIGWAAEHVGSQLADQELNPCTLQWKHRVLTTGPLGNPIKFLASKNQGYLRSPVK